MASSMNTVKILPWVLVALVLSACGGGGQSSPPALALTEVTAIGFTADTTPSYTFHSTRSGSISCGQLHLGYHQCRGGQ